MITNKYKHEKILKKIIVVGFRLIESVMLQLMLYLVFFSFKNKNKKEFINFSKHSNEGFFTMVRLLE